MACSFREGFEGLGQAVKGLCWGMCVRETFRQVEARKGGLLEKGHSMGTRVVTWERKARRGLAARSVESRPEQGGPEKTVAGLNSGAGGIRSDRTRPGNQTSEGREPTQSSVQLGGGCEKQPVISVTTGVCCFCGHGINLQDF